MDFTYRTKSLLFPLELRNSICRIDDADLIALIILIAVNFRGCCKQLLYSNDQNLNSVLYIRFY